jgi:hypothetical protein
LRLLNTIHAPLAAIDSPFSKYLMGACIGLVSSETSADLSAGESLISAKY